MQKRIVAERSICSNLKYPDPCWGKKGDDYICKCVNIDCKELDNCRKNIPLEDEEYKNFSPEKNAPVDYEYTGAAKDVFYYPVKTAFADEYDSYNPIEIPHGYYESIGDPKQIKRCPWCGKEITQENYSISDNRMIIQCPNENCEFSSEEGLPIMLIDEEIYQNPPTFIVSTVDKFAQVALNDGAGAIFGNVKSGNEYLPPDLIIQDELHLISGPLGTVTGLYESAIIGIITRNDRPKPKIIASTATIKNADEQIKALYASGYSQFPAQGIDIEDSFFAIISKPEDKPARKYLGCMGIGTSPTMMMIRVMSSLLFATRYLASLNKYSNDVIDSFWTLTIYFNSLRELGGAIIRVIDDIQAMYEFLKETKFNNISYENKNTLKYCTVQSFKGLESDIVFYIDIEGFSDTKNRMINYVALSRAKSFLYIFFNKSLNDELFSMLF